MTLSGHKTRIVSPPPPVLSLNRKGNRILERERRLKAAMKATQRDGGKLQRRTWDDARMQAAIKDELKGIERVIAENTGTVAVRLPQLTRHGPAAKLRQLGASALFDEREWTGFARLMAAMRQG